MPRCCPCTRAHRAAARRRSEAGHRLHAGAVHVAAARAARPAFAGRILVRCDRDAGARRRSGRGDRGRSRPARAGPRCRQSVARRDGDPRRGAARGGRAPSGARRRCRDGPAGCAAARSRHGAARAGAVAAGRGDARGGRSAVVRGGPRARLPRRSHRDRDGVEQAMADAPATADAAPRRPRRGGGRARDPRGARRDAHAEGRAGAARADCSAAPGGGAQDELLEAVG